MLDYKSLLQILEVQKRDLEKRILQLEQNQQKNEALRSPSMKGSLVMYVRRGKSTCYHQFRKQGQTCRRKLNDGDPCIIPMLKIEYDKRVLKLLRKNLTAIQRFQKELVPLNEIDLADRFHPAKAALCKDLCITREMEACEFLKLQKQSVFHTENLLFETKRGETVRSKSESIIADTLFKYGYVYVTEFPVKTVKGKIRYMDFAILDLRTMEIKYWEHLGMLGNENYSDDAVRKLDEYLQSGFIPGKNLILSFETQQVPFTMVKAEALVKQYLE